MEEIMMWAVGKIRESVENRPRHVRKSDDSACLPFKSSLSHNNHNNVLTPDKIPEFCLPPRLCRRKLQLDAEAVAPDLHGPKQTLKSRSSSNREQEEKDAGTRRETPLPFSADGYELAGIHESLNTRRKESLFHSKSHGYVLEETNPPRRTLPGSKTESRESETASSCSTTSPDTAKSPVAPSGKGLFKGATSCPSLIGRRDDGGRWKKRVWSSTFSPGRPPSLEGSSLTIAPLVLFPLDVLQRQDRAQREHVLPLKDHGQVHLLVERTISASMFSLQSTVRVRVVSVEWKQADRRASTCAVKLCLVPGKLQPQTSSTIRSCCSPVFNEDFFFTQLSREELLELQLRLRVVDKPAAGSLRRRRAIGAIDKPLSQLLSLQNG